MIGVSRGDAVGQSNSRLQVVGSVGQHAGDLNADRTTSSGRCHRPSLLAIAGGGAKVDSDVSGQGRREIRAGVPLADSSSAVTVPAVITAEVPVRVTSPPA